MYRAKRRGGARHELFDEAMHTQAVSRLLTERALRRALDHDELRVLFQPQFDLATSERVGVEALLRWDHPVRGPRAAGRLPARRRGDRHHRADRRVGARPGLRAPADHEDRRPDGAPLGVSTNVSARQLQRADFPELVARARARLRRSIRRRCRWRSPRARCSTISTRPARRCGRSRTSACTSPSTTSAPVDRRSPTFAGSRSTS